MLSTSTLIRKQVPSAWLAAAAAASAILISRSPVDDADEESERGKAKDTTSTTRQAIPDVFIQIPSYYSPISVGKVKDIASAARPLFPSYYSPISSCEVAKAATGGASFRRRQTIRWLNKTASKASLESRYKVDWNNPLGEGGYGAVYVCTDRKTGEQCALKKIPKRYTDLDSFQQEIDALLRVRENGSHPNICQLKENFDERGSFYLVLDLISGGELFDHLSRSGPYSEADAARLVREAASALAFIHGVGVVHADLKPENWMLSTSKKTDSVIKLVDFGCAEIIDDKACRSKKQRTSGGNTPAYSPPEAFVKNWKGPLRTDDMWSMGVLIYIMLTGMHPFDLDGRSTDQEIEERIKSRKPPPIRNSPVTAHLSDSALDLIERLMARRPRRRMTAMQMLNHPWVRGETARKDKMADSDKKLTMFRAFKSRLEAKVFSDWCSNATGDAAKKTSLIESAFKNFDTEQKGYVTAKDLTRTLSRKGDDISAKGESKAAAPLSLSGFSDLLSDHLNNKFYPRGHTIYKEGEKGDAIYFINSGTVEVSTKDGFKTTRSQGEMFGEGALLQDGGRRSAGIRCVTPVHAIRVSKEYFDKYVATSDPELNLSLREKDRHRKRNRAKTLLRLQSNLKDISLNNGEALFSCGDEGDTLYILEEGKLDIKAKSGNTVFSIHPGDICGEHSLIMGKPRNATAVCVTDRCTVHEMSSKDFFSLYNSSTAVRKSLREVCMRRDFVKALVLKMGKQFDESHLREAFDSADLDRTGKLNIEEMEKLLCILDPSIDKDLVKEILESLDLDSSGTVKWEEFRQIFSTGIGG